MIGAAVTRMIGCGGAPLILLLLPIPRGAEGTNNSGILFSPEGSRPTPLTGKARNAAPGGRVVFEGGPLLWRAALTNRLTFAATGCKEFLYLRPYRR